MMTRSNLAAALAGVVLVRLTACAPPPTAPRDASAEASRADVAPEEDAFVHQDAPDDADADADADSVPQGARDAVIADHEAYQPTLPRPSWSPTRCQATPATPPPVDPPPVDPGMFSVRYRPAEAPPVWSLAPDATLWLAHPLVEGRSITRLSATARRDLLVARSPDDRIAAVVQAEGVSTVPGGLTATTAGVLMFVRVAAPALVNDRALVAPSGLTLLRFDRSGALDQVDPTPHLTAVFALRAPDGTGRIVAVATTAHTIRGVRVGGDGPRLVMLRFDPRDALAASIDLGPSSGALDAAIVDDDGGVRVLAQHRAYAFTPDGALRWRADLATGPHALRADGTTWTAAASCAPFGVPEEPIPSRWSYGCVSMLASDGRASTVTPMVDSPTSYDYLSWATYSFHGGDQGAMVVRTAATVCFAGQPVCGIPPRCSRVSFAQTFPRLIAPPTPYCVPWDSEVGASPWGGGVRCTRPCAATASCPRPQRLTGDEHCGAVGRRCAESLAQIHAHGVCRDGECAVTGCAQGWADCDGDPGGRCEVDVTRSTEHCGACGNRCDGTCQDGRCCGPGGCATAVFDSDGRDGPFAPTGDVTLAAGIHRFTRVHVPQGVTVRVGRGGVLDVRATEEVVIEGAIDLTGGDGEADEMTLRGGATGRRIAGDAEGGHGSGPGSGGSSFALAGGEAPGRGGSSIPGVCIVGLEPPMCDNTFTGGTAGAPGYDGFGGREVRFPCGSILRCSQHDWLCTPAPSGGGSIGPRALRDLAVTSWFMPGSGGGFHRCGYRAPPDCVHRGGGGAGGALRVASRTSIRLGPMASVRADGGFGGGSGGVVYFAAPAIDVAPGAYVSAEGGSGGGLGRVRLSVDPARCRVAGTFLPPLPRGCVPSSEGTPCETYVGRWPW